MAVYIPDPEVIVQNFRKHIVIIGKRRTEQKHPAGWNSPRYLRQADVVHVEAISLERFFSSLSRWQCLYFFPLPHQQISFLPSLGMASCLPSIFSSNFMWHPIADRHSPVKFTFEKKSGIS